MKEESLPSVYFSEMERFLSSYKKEHACAKERGQVDEQEADPIPFPLFEKMCKWFLEENNMYGWVWTIFQ